MLYLKFWFQNARPRALAQSLWPTLLALSLAATSPDFSIVMAALSICGVFFAHLSMNLFDDYFDYRVKDSAYREQMVHEGFRARINKCAYLTNGQATVNELLLVSAALCLMSLLCAAVLFWCRGPVIILFIGFLGILGLGYSAPPFRFSYHGLGEPLIAVVFGPLLMSGVYYASADAFNPAMLLIFSAVGLLAGDIVYVHSIMDFEPDLKVGKMTMAVKLKTPERMLTVLFVGLFAPFALVSAGAVFNILPKSYLAVGLVLPLAGYLFYMMVMFIRQPQRTFKPGPWMGPRRGWAMIEKAGLGWFMIRWIAMRNILMFFCLIIIGVNIFSIVCGQ